MVQRNLVRSYLWRKLSKEEKDIMKLYWSHNKQQTDIILSTEQRKEICRILRLLFPALEKTRIYSSVAIGWRFIGTQLVIEKIVEYFGCSPKEAELAMEHYTFIVNAKGHLQIFFPSFWYEGIEMPANKVTLTHKGYDREWYECMQWTELNGDKFLHPHVSTGSQRPCLGGTEAKLIMHHNAGNILMFCMDLKMFLTIYTPEDAYWNFAYVQKGNKWINDFREISDLPIIDPNSYEYLHWGIGWNDLSERYDIVTKLAWKEHNIVGHKFGIGFEKVYNCLSYAVGNSSSLKNRLPCHIWRKTWNILRVIKDYNRQYFYDNAADDNEYGIQQISLPDESVFVLFMIYFFTPIEMAAIISTIQFGMCTLDFDQYINIRHKIISVEPWASNCSIPFGENEQIALKNRIREFFSLLGNKINKHVIKSQNCWDVVCNNEPKLITQIMESTTYRIRTLKGMKNEIRNKITSF